jgi:hypothetical protein
MVERFDHPNCDKAAHISSFERNQSLHGLIKKQRKLIAGRATENASAAKSIECSERRQNKQRYGSEKSSRSPSTREPLRSETPMPHSDLENPLRCACD